MIAIYLILNKITNKRYVGSSVNYDKRKKKHIHELTKNIHANRYLQSAWDKNGWHSFEFIILEVLAEKINIVEREQYWMDYFKSYDPELGYNLRPKAENNQGMVFTEEHKRKIGLGNKGKVISEEQKDRARNQIISSEHRLSISQANKGKLASKETRDKMSASRKGIIKSPEWMEKIRLGNIGKTIPQEQRNKIAETLKNKNILIINSGNEVKLIKDTK